MEFQDSALPASALPGGSLEPPGVEASDSQVPVHPFQELKQHSHFILIRHGESQGNAQGIIQGQVDMPLNQTGRLQARSAALTLAESIQGLPGTKPALLIHSTLSRARETADIISTVLDELKIGHQRRAADLLQEVHTGIFSGRRVDELKQEFPRIWQAYRVSGWDAVPQAEASPLLMSRALQVWKLAVDMANQGHEPLVMVSHGAFLQYLFKASFNPGPASSMPLIHMDNCGISELDIEPVNLDPVYRTGAYGYHANWRRLNFSPKG